MKDCTTCKYGYEDEQLGIPMCHHPSRFSEDCIDFNMHEEKETKESEKPVQNDLEEAAEKSLEETAADFVWDIMENDYYGPSELSKRLRPTSKLNDFYGALAEIFIAGAKWQKGQLLKGSPLPEDTVIFQKGVEEGKRLIMEEAIDGEVYKYDKFSYVKERKSKSLTEALAKFNDGDTVKIIIVKEE